MIVSLNDIKIEPILDSIHRERISDEVYFSDKYKDFVSNSRLSLMDPKRGGPEAYKTGFSDYTTPSLFLGSCVHCLLLQPNEFQLGPDLNRPTAKLGLVLDLIRKYRKNGKTIYTAIHDACKKIGYYAESINNHRVSSIIKSGLAYYWYSRELDDNIILASSGERNTIQNCIKNLEENKFVQATLHPQDVFGDPIPSYNEEAFFINFKCTYNDKEYILKFKMKADNWTIDVENKIITLNDLKTTSHFVQHFMNTSWNDFHYDRQFASYIYVLLRYCEKEYNYNREDWTIKANVIVTETRGCNSCRVFPITLDMLNAGKKEFCKLLKMVAYHEMFGFHDVEFI